MIGIAKFICMNKFRYARQCLATTQIRILDVGCGNNSPTFTKQWFPGCHYSGVDIQRYNNTDEDIAAMDEFFLVGTDGSGYSAIPDKSFEYIILHHVIEHMQDPRPVLATLCAKLKPGGFIWIAFPSLHSLALPRAEEATLQFCDDDTHIYVPSVREVSNVLLGNGIRILHAGRSTDWFRGLLGCLILPWAFLRRAVTGKLNARGLWYVLGFEDHVFGQRKCS